MRLKQKSGIYFIHIQTSKKHYVYIGQSKNISKRIYQHKYQLKSNKHYNVYLQSVYNKYGITEVKAIYFDQSFLNIMEQALINIYSYKYECMNMMPVMQRDYTPTNEVKRKISKTLKEGNWGGRNHSFVNKTVYKFYNVRTKEVFTGICFDLRSKHSELTAKDLDSLVRKRVRVCKDWCLYKNKDQVKPTRRQGVIYKFQNVKTEEIVIMRRPDFQRTYGISSGEISELLNPNPNRRKRTQARGWRILGPLDSNV